MVLMDNLKEIETKLNEFRSHRRQEKKEEGTRYNWWPVRHRTVTAMSPINIPMNDNQDRFGGSDDSDRRNLIDESVELDNVYEDESGDNNKWTKLDYAVVTVKLLVYCIGQVIAVLVQFGAVFFAIALLFFICTNLRTKKRKKGELSAYSVFNPNCQPIHGTVNADQLAAQLTFGALHHI